MYNKLLLRDNKSGRIMMAFGGHLVDETVNIRMDIGKDGTMNRFSAVINKKEAIKTIEYLLEFLRLLNNAR